MTANVPWDKVFSSWDTVNTNLHLSSKKHIQKLNGPRMSTASVSRSGTRIYAL